MLWEWYESQVCCLLRKFLLLVKIGDDFIAVTNIGLKYALFPRFKYVLKNVYLKLDCGCIRIIEIVDS